MSDETRRPTCTIECRVLFSGSWSHSFTCTDEALAASREEATRLRERLDRVFQDFEDLLMVATKDEDADGFISAYHFKTGAIHRMLGKVRQRYETEPALAPPPPAPVVPTGPYCNLAASEIPGFGTDRDTHRCAKLHREHPLPKPEAVEVGQRWVESDQNATPYMVVAVTSDAAQIRFDDGQEDGFPHPLGSILDDTYLGRAVAAPVVRETGKESP
jgi:hypothetical protein